jgi:hypothetical protein
MDFVIFITSGCKIFATEKQRKHITISVFPCPLWQKNLLIIFHFVNKNDARKY